MVWTALGGLDATKAKKAKDKIKIFIENLVELLLLGREKQVCSSK